MSSTGGTDTRDKRAIEQIDCPNPRCNAKAGQPCTHPFPTGRVPCCTVRRKANQERLQAIQRDLDQAIKARSQKEK
jgi:hypothetical protein